jgi:hypothetical protein
MTNARDKGVAKRDARWWSRREVLARGSRLGVLLALPELWIPKAWSQTAPFDYFISTSGNDSNPGTLAQPWAITSFEIASPNFNKMAGKRIGIMAGNYSLAKQTQPDDWSLSLVNIPGGSASASTYVASCDTNGNYSPRAATLTWTGAQLTPGIIGSNGVTAPSGYVTIDGLVINGGPLGGSGANSASGHLVNFYAPSWAISSAATASMVGIVVQNCEIHGILQTQTGQNLAGLFLAGTVNALIQNNYIHDCNVTAGGNAGNAQHIGACAEIGCSGTQYLYNTIANCPNGNGIWGKEGSSSVTIAYNYFYNCGTGSVAAGQNCGAITAFNGYGGAPNPGPGQRVTIHHNIIDGNASDRNMTQPEADVSQLFYNNTIYSTGTFGGQWACELYVTTDNASICNAYSNYYNNIYCTSTNATNSSGGTKRNGRLCLNGGTPFGGAAAGGSNGSGWQTVDHNCWYDLGANYTAYWGLAVAAGTTGYNSFAAWKTAAQAIVAGTESHSICAQDPKFSAGTASIVSGAGSAQFKLASGSPCIGLGQSGGNMGAWDGTVTQIGCSFALGGSAGPAPAVPTAPTLTVS